MASRRRDERAKVFTIGAAYGFVAGVFAMSLLVWRFSDVMPSRVLPIAQPEPAARVAPAPAPAATTGVLPPGDDAAMAPPPARELADRDLEMPVEGVTPDQLTRQFGDPRGGGRRHEALDILAPHGTPVRAVENGRIARLFYSKAGGITIYQFDPTEQFCYYYAHLDRYADGLREQEVVRRGQVIGYVGVSGNAPKNTPHLHFAIFRLDAEKRWWKGTPIDPYDVLR